MYRFLFLLNIFHNTLFVLHFCDNFNVTFKKKLLIGLYHIIYLCYVLMILYVMVLYELLLLCLPYPVSQTLATSPHMSVDAVLYKFSQSYDRTSF